MNRPPFYTGSIWRSFDIGSGFKDVANALGQIVGSMLGSQPTVVSGFSAAQSTPTANLSITLASGNVFQLGEIDPTSFGSLPVDTTITLLQGCAPQQTLTFTTAALAAGQQQYALVQCEFLYVDAVRTGDPTGGVIPFWNAAMPSNPLQGPNGSGAVLNTVRQGTANVSIIYGNVAGTGLAVPPAPSSGCVPMYLVLLSFGQASITNGQILTAGPSAYTGYTQAPFLAGLLHQHHLGTTGQAPQIDLTAEVKNQLPLTNLPASNTTGLISTFRGIVTTSPVGTLAGNIDDTCYDSANNTWYVCTATGTASTATWGAVGASSSPTFIENDTWPYSCTSGFIDVLGKVSTGNGVFNLPAASSLPNATISVAKKDSSANSIIVTTTGTGDTISEGLNTGLTTFNVSVQGNWFTFRNLYDTATSEWIWYVK